MLTVDYDKLGLEPGHHLLDLGCGFGRHAFEALKRGAHVTACDMAYDELSEVITLAGVMHNEGEVAPNVSATVAQGDATRLPFGDATFDRIIASEVLEHIPNDFDAFAELTRVLKPGGVMAVTVPAFLTERICWALNSDFHAPTEVGGHVRIYTTTEMRARMTSVGLEPGESHFEHGLHSPYWWLKCAVGLGNDDHPLVKRYHDLLVWDITKGPRVTRLADKAMSRVIGKSMVMYGHKPNDHASLQRTPSGAVPATATA